MREEYVRTPAPYTWIHLRDLAARCARVVANVPPVGGRGRAPQERARRDPQGRARGMPGARSTRGPCAKGSKHTVVTTVAPVHPAFPHAMVLRLIPRSSRRRIRLVTVANGLGCCRTRLGRLASAGLTPATGARTTRLCRTQPPAPKLSTGLVPARRSFNEGGFSIVRLHAAFGLTGLTTRPARAFARPMPLRPPHPIPTFVTMANAPRAE